MKRVVRILAVLAACLLVAPGLFAAEVDWPEVKKIWHTLTAAEQAAYQEMMPAPAQGMGRVNILGTLVEPVVRTPGDTCGAATNEVSALPFAGAGDTTALVNDYDVATSVTCSTGFDSNSPDDTYLVQVDQTCDVFVSATSPIAGHDVVLWAVTDCADADNTCVGSADTGNPEEFGFTATAGTDYWVIVDGWNGGVGDYTLDITETTATGCMLVVPVKLESFSID